MKVFCAGLLAAALLAIVPGAMPNAAAGREFGPQGVVREFCRADGMGYRLRSVQWPRIRQLLDSLRRRE